MALRAVKLQIQKLLFQSLKHGYTLFHQVTLEQLRQQEIQKRASLVAQWLRICLLMQGTRVQALVWEDPTCRGATGPVSHNY